MAVVEQKLSKVAHSLYADAEEDATNNSIKSRSDSFSARFQANISAFPPRMFRNYERRWCYFYALSSGEETLAGDQPIIPRPSPVERASSEMNVVFGIVLRPDGRSPEVRLPPHPQKKAKTPKMTLGVFAYSFIWICRPRGPTFVEKTICVLVSPKRCRSVMNSSSSIVFVK